ncbi:MAG: DUF1122 family protein [Archaeoglobi archaeon]|nr:DUF1122 family protein [Candidatus Mnemosynella sp.]
MAGLERAIEVLRDGIPVSEEMKIYSGMPKKGRFKEEINLTVFAERDSNVEFLMNIKIFKGRGKHYREWVELFRINPDVFGIRYFGSPLESKVLDLFSKFSGRIFVEYYEDEVTKKELLRGFPPALSRLGFELLKRGYSWIKDWYYPEGFMEGGQKLQGEKASNEDVRIRHLKKIEEEYLKFISTHGDDELIDELKKRFKLMKSPFLWEMSIEI